ncbi:hypothetical protein GGR02_003019 [Anoxybacillus voinovskiensis]|uniref:Uncharacterized protein n=1 Tax=Anoxybacteroides voinovskiense TaxID=230470 RepID=A0A840DUI6_9BACL|nr:hypothetical protein [Anoxybacillus voinovskiensis]MBB4075202.1 hypothetical protein [Anoxybacillus voinovskiensis]GGJ77105.1 hypothetical protein GCM10008982_28070 [Anoxybacillus voinovskiensis]
MALAGDTVRLRCHFRSFDGQNIDPADVKLRIYDTQKQLIEEFILDDSQKENVGIFYFDYILPDDKQEIIFEFRGLYDGKPILTRGQVKIKYI